MKEIQTISVPANLVAPKVCPELITEASYEEEVRATRYNISTVSYIPSWPCSLSAFPPLASDCPTSRWTKYLLDGNENII